MFLPLWDIFCKSATPTDFWGQKRTKEAGFESFFERRSPWFTSHKMSALLVNVFFKRKAAEKLSKQAWLDLTNLEMWVIASKPNGFEQKDLIIKTGEKEPQIFGTMSFWINKLARLLRIFLYCLLLAYLMVDKAT